MTNIFNETPAQNSINPSENYDMYRLYTYPFDNIPDFGRFKEQREMSNTRIKQIKDWFLNEPMAEAFITVDSNTNCIVKGNHTYEAYKLLVSKYGYKGVLVVRYLPIPADSLSRVRKLTEEENSKKWQLPDYVRSFAKNGNCYEKLMNVVNSHPFLKKNKGMYRVALSAGWGQASKVSKNIKKGTFGTNGDPERIEKIIPTIDECVLLIDALGLQKGGSYIEAFVAAYHNFREQNKTWFKYHTINDICNIIPQFSDSEESQKWPIEQVQQYEYWEQRFTVLLDYYKKSLKKDAA